MDPGSLIPANDYALRDLRSPLSIELARQPGYPPTHAQDSVLREYLRILIKRKWIVAASVVLIVGTVLIATLRSTPIYEAIGSIAINKPDPVLNFSNAGNNFDYYDPTDLDTESRILRSDLLALQVIKELNLDQQAQFGGNGKSQTGSLELTTETTTTTKSDSEKTTAALDAFKGSLKVVLEPNTRIIDIHFRSPDPNLAARVVNTLANTYVEQNFKTRFESTMQTSDWLSKQLVDLQMKVETSQEKLVKYQKDHEILGIDEKQNLTTAKLDELNKELTAAQSARMEKESVYRLVQPGDSDSIAAASSMDAKGANSNSLLLERLRGQEADLKIQIAQLSTQFGPSYPKLLQLNGQLQETEAQVQSEVKKAGARLHGDYLTALQRESLLHEALEKQKQEANKLNESAIEFSLLKRDFESNRTLYEGLLEKLKEAGVTAGLRSNNVRPVDIARTPTAPSEPNLPRNLSFALALGLTTGIGLCFVLDSIDNTVRTPEQAQIISGLPSLGMIPMGSRHNAGLNFRQRVSIGSSREVVEVITQTRPQSQMAESYRALRTSLLLTSLGTPPKVILVTSALPEEGKTTTSINSAIVLAQRGTRVLLIDADLRRPSIHKTLGMAPTSGLSNVLTGGTSLAQAIVPSNISPNLSVLPAGTPPPNPAELLASSNMATLLAELCDQYDHIVIDTPPTLSVTDAVIMATRADAVILVIRAGQTTKQALRRARDVLTQVNARICGVLLNAVNLNSPDYHYYYEYQGKYGHRYYADETVGATSHSA